MIRILNHKEKFIFIIPAILLLWNLFLNHFSGPFFLSNIDPEYPYLLNGLNFALADFIRIGHFDHPGTPFQLLTGMFIHIIYWTIGQGSLVEDVISRPELYLKGASFFLSLLTAGIIFWIGKIVMRFSNSKLGAVILQSSLFLSTVLIDISSRYYPDRLLAILILVFIGLCFKHFYQDDFKGKKFAIYSGILMGIGFITKFNLLPLLFVPFLVIENKKDRLTYIGFFFLSAILSSLPVIDRFSYFKDFITNIITHDGLHGEGAEQVFNFQDFLFNSTLVFQNNISFLIVFLSAIIFLVVLFVKKDLRNNHKKEFLFLLAFLIVTVISVVMVSKHYKNYYLVPVLSLTGFVLYILWKLSNSLIQNKNLNKVFAILLVVLILIPAIKLYPSYISAKQTIIGKNLSSSIIKNSVSPTDYLLIESTWLPGPLVQNALVYGVSYSAFRHYFYNDYQKFYPNILTWEGSDNPLKYFRMIEADNEAIIKSGKNIYIHSAPDRKAKQLIDYLKSNAAKYGVSLSVDTVYANSNNLEYLIKVCNNDNWKTLNEANCGFERVKENTLLSDNENTQLAGDFELSSRKVCNGLNSLKLSGNFKTSPKFVIDNVSSGDYLEITIKRRKNKNDKKGEIVICEPLLNSYSTLFTKSESISSVSSKWEIIRLSFEIEHQPTHNTILIYYRYEGDKTEYLDDFSFRHMSEK